MEKKAARIGTAQDEKVAVQSTHRHSATPVGEEDVCLEHFFRLLNSNLDAWCCVGIAIILSDRN
jgi:hypothetical protein